MNSNLSKDVHAGMHLSSVLNKEIMSEIRQGDYQHPGEEEAIDLVFNDVVKDESQRLLDVGCGRGGTVAYLQKQGYGQALGIDLNNDLINYAKEHYENGGADFPCFINGDVVDIETILIENQLLSFKPDIIYLFNSFFLFPNHVAALKALNAISHHKTQLIIFDYVDKGVYMQGAYAENEKIFLPNCIKTKDICSVFEKGGWTIAKNKNMDQQYINWYKELMQKIESYKQKYTKKYGDDVFKIFVKRYQHILTALENDKLGAVTLYAQYRCAV